MTFETSATETPEQVSPLDLLAKLEPLDEEFPPIENLPLRPVVL
jgi:hypothetical protein